MECERIAETCHIVISFAPRIVWRVYAYAEVTPDDKHTDIDTYAYSRTQCKVAEETFGL